MKHYISKSQNQTMKIAMDFAKKLKGGDVVVLNGEMGAGKTAFAKGAAKGLGILQLITSPTFTLVNTYKGKYNLHHFDMYRIQNLNEALAAGILDCFNKDSICIIEWPEKIEEILPKRYLKVDIEIISENERGIDIYENFGD